MANMSYCRFENTASDLTDCLDVMLEACTAEDLVENLSDYEKNALRRLIELCRGVVDQVELLGEEEIDRLTR